MESIYKLMDELLIQLIEEGTALFPVDNRLYLWSFDSILQECRTEGRTFLTTFWRVIKKDDAIKQDQDHSQSMRNLFSFMFDNYR